MSVKSSIKTNQRSVATSADINYHELFNVLPGKYIVFAANDPAFTIIDENQAHAEIAYVKPEDIIGKPLLEAFPDTSDKYRDTGVSDLIESLRRVLKSHKPDPMAMVRYDIKGPDGLIATKFWRFTHYPVYRYDDSGTKQLYAIFQATEDITDSVQADQRLATTEKQLEDVLSAGLIGTWLWDIKKDVVIGDRYMADMFGVPVDEAAIGMPLATFVAGIHPDDRPRVRKQIRAAIKSSNIFESEYRTTNSDGTVSWVIARGRIERDASNAPVHFPGVLVDITERKLIENNLSYLAKASAVLSASLDYHKTLQSITELMVPEMADWCSVDMVSDDNRLELVALAHKDPAKIKWARKLRQEQGPPDLDEPTGTPNVIRTMVPEFYPYISDEMLVASAKSATELKLLRELSLTSVIIVPIIVDGSGVGAITMIATDQKRPYTQSDLEMSIELGNRASLAISNARLYNEARHELQQRKQLEEKLRIANEDLEHRVDVRTNELEQSNLSLQRSNQELQDFAYVASHDLQEPLRKIQAFGNLLASEYADKLGESGSDYLVRMRNAAARMSILIDDILSFSRVTTKGREFTSVNLGTVVQEVSDDLEIRISETSAKLNIGELPTIHADAVQMRQLIQNLLANAIKFHREGVAPVISITSSQETTAEKRKFCRLEISDNGLGFDERYLNRIFAVFQRLHGRENYEGTGIGLAVCRKIVERHGGWITAKSQPNIGSTFIVTLPLRHKKGENLL